MNMETLAIVKFGDVDSLGEFLFENGMQHRIFQQYFMDSGIQVPVFPIMEANPDNLDDWLMVHQVEHQAFANILNLNNPFNLFDSDWNKEEDFYDWVANHYYIHEQIVAALNISS